MQRFLLTALVQCILISSGQLLLKIAMKRLPAVECSLTFCKAACTNWPLIVSGFCVLSGTLLWMYILRHWDFSLAYPVSSFSYVIGMVLAPLLLQEHIPAERWLGLAFVIVGIYFISRQ